MTPEDVKALSDDALRIRVAELCEYKFVHPWMGDGNEHVSQSMWAVIRPDGTSTGVPYTSLEVMLKDDPELGLPNYPRDLNAMHEAEGGLPDAVQMRYARYLLEVSTGCGPNMPLGFLNGATLWVAVFATARQRAEAFVLTMENQ
jgi:hypothetical protein